MRAMKCPECGGTVSEKIGTHAYLGDELPNVELIGVKLRTCEDCGATSVVIPKLARLHRLLAATIAKSAHQLAPGEIRFLRKHLGWSGQDFARHFGVTPETVSRWENGAKPMGPTAERLLRLSALVVDPVEEYPLPDELGERPSGVKFSAALDHEWRIRAA
ncbi:MAG: helix-turn-helix domain-containing protein [Deltaproteobacteria bacterium]|nr:helix-turn-helix domain-containing protein [Deltaproteobacteria bacterium]